MTGMGDMTRAQMLGQECTVCGVDLGYAVDERPVLVGGRGLRRCAPACEVVEVPLDQGVAVVVRAGAEQGLVEVLLDIYG